MPLLQCLMLLCLVSAAQSIPRPDADQTRRVKRSDYLSVNDVLPLVQQQASMMDKLQADLTAYKNQVQSELTSYKNQVASYQNQVASMGSQLQAMQHKMDAASKSVAFTARISESRESIADGLALGHHETVVFDYVVTNIGNAYNHSNGVFTAPVDGTYVFFLQQMSTNKHGHEELAIVKDAAVLDLTTAEGAGDPNDQGTTQVTTHMAAGDHVWVRQNHGDGIRGDWWTVFTGFLLHSD